MYISALRPQNPLQSQLRLSSDSKSTCGPPRLLAIRLDHVSTRPHGSRVGRFLLAHQGRTTKPAITPLPLPAFSLSAFRSAVERFAVRLGLDRASSVCNNLPTSLHATVSKTRRIHFPPWARPCALGLTICAVVGKPHVLASDPSSARRMQYANDFPHDHVILSRSTTIKTPAFSACRLIVVEIAAIPRPCSNI